MVSRYSSTVGLRDSSIFMYTWFLLSWPMGVPQIFANSEHGAQQGYHLAESHAHLARTFAATSGRSRRWRGISVTTICGRESKAVFKRNAVWLCKGCSHQCATTNSGRITVNVSFGCSSCTVSM